MESKLEKIIYNTQKELNSLFELYKEITGSKNQRAPTYADAKSLLHNEEWEYRLGSEWTRNSKLKVYKLTNLKGFPIVAEFDLNMDNSKFELLEDSIKQKIRNSEERVEKESVHYMKKLEKLFDKYEQI